MLPDLLGPVGGAQDSWKSETKVIFFTEEPRRFVEVFRHETGDSHADSSDHSD